MAKSWSWGDKHQQRWSAIRAKGRTRYILVNGVLSYGLPMFLVLGVSPKLFNFPFPARPSDTYWLWQPLLWAAAGAIYGVGTWYASERSYRRYETKAP